MATLSEQATRAAIVRNRTGHPPDLQDAAVQTVLLQAETLCRDWAA